MKRPILIALIGYIMGVLLGLYLKISIALIFIFLFIIYKVLDKLVFYNKLKRLRRYVKIFIKRSLIITIVITSFISNTIILYKDYQYNNKYANIKECKIVATVVSRKIEKQYTLQYKVKVESLNGSKKYKDDYLLLYIDKNQSTFINFGDKIIFEGEYIEPSDERNYKGFNYKNYLKSKQIYGSVKTSSVKIIKKNNVSLIMRISENILEKIVKKTYGVINDENKKNLLIGIMLGKDENLNKDIRISFKDSSLAHILAVSGMHVSYLIIGLGLILSKLQTPKKISKIIIIIFLILFIYITGAVPSVKRACIMAILALIASIVHKKSDTINNISIAMLILLIQNPFCIRDISVILSFSATISIIIFYKQLLDKFYKINIKIEESLLYTLFDKIKQVICVSLAANICIIPVMIISFNTLSITFLFSNLLISLIIGPVIILGFLSVIVPINPILSFILDSLLGILIQISNIFSNLEISKITIITPNFIVIIAYYILVFSLNYLYILKNKVLKRRIEKQVLTIVDKFKYAIFKLAILLLIIILLIVPILKNISKEIKIYFIDVGQGDSTLIITPEGKKILIDGGGSKDNSEYDVGESVLMPYLLDRGINRIDYIIVSHFDADHVRTDY